MDMGVMVHNCGTFVETIVQGGGGTTGNPLNCPVLPHTVEQFIHQIIVSQMVVPQGEAYRGWLPVLSNRFY